MRSVIYQLRAKKKTIPLKEQIQFLNRLIKLLEKNYTFKKTLELMTYDPQFSKLATSFLHLLHDGSTVEDSFRKLKFDSTVIAYMYFTKESGQMLNQIKNCNQILSMREKLQDKLKKIIRYPTFLIIISVFLFIMMSSYLFPLYTNTFYQMEHNGALTFFYTVDSIFKAFMITILILMVIGMITYFVIYKNLSLENKIKWINNIPIVSNMFRLFTSMQLAYHIASILQNGRTIKETLTIITKQQELKVLQLYSKKMISVLADGKSLFDSVAGLSLIENDLKQLIRRADQDGTLLSDLQAYSTLLLDTIEQKFKRLLFIIQPTLYSIIGLFILLIYFFALFPMFQLIQYL